MNRAAMEVPMHNSAAKAAILALAIMASAPAAFAFDGSTDDPGSHMASLRSALAELYGLSLSAPLKLKNSTFASPAYSWSAYRATDLLSDASRDADWYFFGDQAAHAQTDEFDYGKKRSPESLKAIESKALYGYIAFMNRWLTKARAAFKSGDAEKGLYYVGFVTHCYQDLWAHRGITNGMHKALLKYMDLDVDRNLAREEEMESKLALWLTAMPEILGSEASQCYLDAVLSNPTMERPSLSKRAKMLGRRRDVFWEGTMYAVFQGDPKSSLNYLQEIEWDVDALSAILVDPEAFALAAALENPEEIAVFLESRGYVF
jgi:hypothetical protein